MDIICPQLTISCTAEEVNLVLKRWFLLYRGSLENFSFVCEVSSLLAFNFIDQLNHIGIDAECPLKKVSFFK